MPVFHSGGYFLSSPLSFLTLPPLPLSFFLSFLCDETFQVDRCELGWPMTHDSDFEFMPSLSCAHALARGFGKLWNEVQHVTPLLVQKVWAPDRVLDSI